MENVTEYLSENNFDQIDDIQDTIAEDEVKSDTLIEKYGCSFFNYFLKKKKIINSNL